jgi:hypothetical protein
MKRRLVRHVLDMLALACLLLYSAAGLGDTPREISDHPGFRPDSPQAASFVAEHDKVTIVVHPTIVRRAQRTAHSFASQSQLVELLGAAGIAARSGNTRVNLGRLVRQSQWELFQSDLSRIAEKVSGRHPDAHYHLVLEFLLPVSDGEIFGIECYIVDQEGNNAFSFLLNSHHRLFVDARLVARNSSEEARSEMFARATQAAFAALQAQIAEQQGKADRAAAREAMLASGDYAEVVFDDFEAMVPTRIDAHGVPVGFVTFSDGRSRIDVSTTVSHPVVPGAAPGNRVLQLQMDVESWAGFAHFFLFS